jgi:hypothetical protein
MKNFKGISKLKKEKESEMRLETDLVNQYKEAISGLFRTVSFEMDNQKNKNSFYYFDSILNFSNLITKEYQSNKALNTIKEIELFNRMIIDLLKDIVQFFIAIDNYDSHKNKTKDSIILSKTNIEDGLKNLGQFDLKIKGDFSTKDSSIAAKEYCLKVIKESLYLLNNSIYVDIEKCPFQFDFNKITQKLEYSIINLNDETGIDSNSKKRKSKINAESNFIDFITNVTEKEAFAQELKNTFNIEIGIDFKIMIELLKDHNILIIRERKFLLFFNFIELYFSRDIGGYSGLNDRYKHSDSDKKVHHIRITKISQKLQPLIDKYKTKPVVQVV